MSNGKKYMLIYNRLETRWKLIIISDLKMQDLLLKQNSNNQLNCSQSKRFENLAYLSGTVLFLAFLKFPVIRVQPGFRRVGGAAALAFPFYYYMADLAKRLKLKRSIIFTKFSKIRI